MSYFQAALRLAKHGFHVFPLVPDGKVADVKEYQFVATRDPEKIKVFWTCPVTGMEQPFNVGISTSRFGKRERLVVLDVDNKDGRCGDDDIIRLELQGKILPRTYEQVTPTGGWHIVYRTPWDVKISNGRRRLGQGIDIRGFGGLLVGSGSDIEGVAYLGNFAPVVEAPEWVIRDLARAMTKTPAATTSLAVDEDYAAARAERYLREAAPAAALGSRGSTAYLVACHLKDLGVASYTAFELMLEHWAERCDPPMPDEDLATSVENAYRYGKKEKGVAAPEADFPPVAPTNDAAKANGSSGHPFEILNREYAFILAGGGHHILWETTDPQNNPCSVHLKELSFHRKFAAKQLSVGNGKTEPLTRLWMQSPKRRSYKGFCFRPGEPTPEGYYNLFRGFAVTPATDEERDNEIAQRGVAAFKEHALFNVCNNNVDLYKWLMAYFAHLFQKPWEKPKTALVFKGRKGTGKNALLARVGYLLGSHYRVVADRRYLISNFNSHLENCLLFILDEAFWSGDKAAEGVLKHVITGDYHEIEHKGQESYRVENRTRVAILGNEDWIVPASEDERRYAVFEVGDGRRKDNAFFDGMRLDMEAGGYRLLLRELLELDIRDIDVNAAPDTEGLLEQKLKTLEPLQQWWFECLTNGEIVGTEFYGAWPKAIIKDDVRDAFRTYLSNRRLGRARIPEDRSFGRTLLKMVPETQYTKVKNGDGNFHSAYQFPALSEAQDQFEKFIGHAIRWDEETRC